MALDSTITIGGNTYHVYALTADPVADADAYLAARIGSTWSTATTLQKQQALISAARMLDRAVFWSGVKSDAAQDLQWPRDGASDACTGEPVPDGTIPDEIALAEFELANILFVDATAQDSPGTGSNVKRVAAGSASVEFFSPTTDTPIDTRLPTPVNDLVACLFATTEGLGGATSFGTDVESSFDDPDERAERSEGFP